MDKFTAGNIVADVIKDLKSRKGFDSLFDDLDTDIIDDIFDDLVEVVMEHG